MRRQVQHRFLASFWYAAKFGDRPSQPTGPLVERSTLTPEGGDVHPGLWWLRMSSLGGLVFGNWTQAMAATAEDYGPWGMHMMWGSWGIGMMLTMLLFGAVAIAGVVVLIRWLLASGHSGRLTNSLHGRESAIDILNKHYARGEIGKQEFEDIRQDIRATA